MPLLKSEIAALSITATQRDSTCHSTVTWALNLLVCVSPGACTDIQINKSKHTHKIIGVAEPWFRSWVGMTSLFMPAWPIRCLWVWHPFIMYKNTGRKSLLCTVCHMKILYIKLITCCSSCDDTYWCRLWLFSVITYFLPSGISKSKIFCICTSFLLAFSAVGRISEKTWVQMLSSFSVLMSIRQLFCHRDSTSMLFHTSNLLRWELIAYLDVEKAHPETKGLH